MTDDGDTSRGRPATLTEEAVLSGFEEVDRPVATAGVLTEVLDAPKRTVLRRLNELCENGRVERWEVGARAVVWWPVEACE